MRKHFVILIIALLFLLQPASVFAADTGATSPGSVAEVDKSGAAYGWTNVTNATAGDDVYATSSPLATNTPELNAGLTEYLNATNFGFSIPSTATINGVEVTIERKACRTNTIDDAEIRLTTTSSTPSGDNKADTSTKWSTTDTTVTYGTDSDTWGLSLTPALVNGTTFGVAFAASNDAVTTACFVGEDTVPDVYIDHISITVHYTLAAASEPSGGGGNGTWLIQIRQQNGLDQWGNPISSSSSSSVASSASTEEPTHEAATMSGATEGTTFSASSSASSSPQNFTETKDWSWVSDSDPAPAAWIVNFRLRACDRVERWFAPKPVSVLTSVLPRLNRRLNNRWGFGCAAPLHP